MYLNRVLFVFVLSLSGSLFGDEAVVNRADWGRFFGAFEGKGCIAVLDQRENRRETFVYAAERARARFSPASTFKVPHALFALDAGLIEDEFEVIAWDGQQRFHPPWNADHTLRSSMRHSVVWVYQVFARELGEKRERDYLTKVNYGNLEPTGEEPFWINGNLEISANEQIAFLERLYANEFPFEVEHQRLVKDVMIVEAQPDWILRAKTGWSGKIAWWIGWVETFSGPVFFALNIDTPNGFEDLPMREAITRKVLASLEVFGSELGD